MSLALDLLCIFCNLSQCVTRIFLLFQVSVLYTISEWKNIITVRRESIFLKQWLHFNHVMPYEGMCCHIGRLHWMWCVTVLQYNTWTLRPEMHITWLYHMIYIYIYSDVQKTTLEAFLAICFCLTAWAEDPRWARTPGTARSKPTVVTLLSIEPIDLNILPSNRIVITVLSLFLFNIHIINQKRRVFIAIIVSLMKRKYEQAILYIMSFSYENEIFYCEMKCASHPDLQLKSEAFENKPPPPEKKNSLRKNPVKKRPCECNSRNWSLLSFAVLESFPPGIQDSHQINTLK